MSDPGHAPPTRTPVPGRTTQPEGLAVKALQEGGVGQEVGVRHLQGHVDVEGRAVGEVDRANAAGPQAGPRQVRRCILSVTPDSGASLQGLGALLDEAEAARRRQVFGEDDRVSDPSTGAARPPRPGYGNADPWYDGRAHASTIVDAPRAGTLLATDEIEAIFLRFGGGPSPQPLACSPTG
jgi:hypothetical protein